MKVEKVQSAIDSVGETVAVIRHRANPAQPYYARIEHFQVDKQSGHGILYLFWIDRRIMASYSETLTRIDVRNLISIKPTEISIDDIQVAHLGDRGHEILSDRNVFPGPWNGLPRD